MSKSIESKIGKPIEINSKSIEISWKSVESKLKSIENKLKIKWKSVDRKLKSIENQLKPTESKLKSKINWKQLTQHYSDPGPSNVTSLKRHLQMFGGARH